MVRCNSLHSDSTDWQWFYMSDWSKTNGRYGLLCLRRNKFIQLVGLFWQTVNTIALKRRQIKVVWNERSAILCITVVERSNIPWFSLNFLFIRKQIASNYVICNASMIIDIWCRVPGKKIVRVSMEKCITSTLISGNSLLFPLNGKLPIWTYVHWFDKLTCRNGNTFSFPYPGGGGGNLLHRRSLQNVKSDLKFAGVKLGLASGKLDVPGIRHIFLCMHITELLYVCFMT